MSEAMVRKLTGVDLKDAAPGVMDQSSPLAVEGSDEGF
jgi:hypothetical protein